MRDVRALLAATALLAFAGLPAQAQQYPSRPISMVVAYPPGGATDIAARIYSAKLAEQLGRPVVVENRAGAGGVIGTDYVARAAPDGHTLIFMVDANTIMPALYSKLSWDPIRDFAPISMTAVGAHAFLAHPSFGPNNVKELIEHAKRTPESYASPGNGSAQHLGMELFKMRAGIDLQHIPYQGGAPTLTGLAGGHVKVGIVALASALPFIRSGKLKALAVTGDQRSPSLPSVPTVAESGLPGFATLQWFGVLAPAGTPAPIISRLHAEIMTASKDPGVAEKLAAVALEVRTSPTPDDLGRFMKEDVAKWPPIVKAAGVKVD